MRSIETRSKTPGKQGYYGRLYDGVRDAEFILEKLMHRDNWNINVRDKIAAKLIQIVDEAKRADQWD